MPGWDCHGLPIEVKALAAADIPQVSFSPSATLEEKESVFRRNGVRIRKQAKEFASNAMMAQMAEMR